ncbi:MAG: flagellin [Clostridia bacterium]|nr:flagellin [Clostridia bacterium]MDQ7791673.1 flagellin [Clostridia bacterium]
MRISTNLFFSNILHSIRKEDLGRARTMEQIATGQRINRLSDDPPALSQVLSLRSATNEIEDYVLSIDQQLSRLNRAEEALAQATEVFQDAYGLAVQGSSGTYSDNDLNTLAFQVDRMITAVVGFANASRGGIKPEGLFTRSETEVTYTRPPESEGTTEGQGWGRVLTLNMLVETIDPGEVFKAEYAEGDPDTGRATMFDTLFKLRDALRDGNQDGVSVLLGELQGHVDALVQGRSDIGSRGYQLERLRGQIEIQKEQLTEVMSKIGDTDIAEAAIRINRHELVMQATLSTAARLMNLSLLNYLS